MKRFTILLAAFMLATPLTTASAQPNYLCGDANQDGAVNLLDILAIIDHIYVPNGMLINEEMSDVNNDGQINLLDILKLIQNIYDYTDELSCGLPGFDSRSDCLNAKDKAVDTMYVEVIGSDIHVHHDSAYYDCCLGYATTNTINNDTVIVTQLDTIPECDCYCYFNLESVIYEMVPGTYVVILVGLQGQIVGVDTATVTGATGPEHSEEQSDCAYNKDGSDDDSVFVQVVGNDLAIYHINAFYNCGLAYVVNYSILDNFITAAEADTGMPADCICYFNLESTLYDLEEGSYVVRVLDIYGEQIFEGEITVGGEGWMQSYGNSGCLEKTPDKLAANVEYIYDNGVLTMNHYDAYFNCAADLVVAFSQSNDTLRFYEFNVSNQYVYCMCYFEIQAVVAGIAPGSYFLELYGEEPTVLLDSRKMTF